MAVLLVILSTVASTAWRFVVVPATVLVMPPAVVIKSPFAEYNPPWPARTVPLEKVLVAAFDCKMLPPDMVMPELVAMSPGTARPE